jgi:hypothetical protein
VGVAGMTKYMAIGMVVLAAAAAFLGWLLLDAHEALGKAELKAQLNADTIKIMADQDERNQKIDARLEQLSGARDTVTKETVREIYIQPSTDACRKSPAMRALDGRLRYQPGNPDGRPAAPTAPPQPLQAPSR